MPMGGLRHTRRTMHTKGDIHSGVGPVGRAPTPWSPSTATAVIQPTPAVDRVAG